MLRISDLQAFVMVADLSSFHAAADQLNITQPALSRRIHKLEEMIGVMLFTRTTRQVHLTAAGRNFLERARKIVIDTEESLASLRGASSDRRELIRIGCLPSLGMKLIPPVLDEFLKRYPFVALRVLDMNAIELVEEVARGTLDLGIGMYTASNPNVQFNSLAREALGVVCHQKHPVAKCDALRWRDLRDYPMASNIQQSGNWLKIQRALEDEAIQLNWFHQVRSMLGAVMTVQSGDGLAVVPRSAVDVLGIPGLVFREVAEPTIHRDIGVLTPSTSMQTIYVREFVAKIEEHMSSLNW
ncbi:LysR family transcriptional regulator [Vreelandella zhaodongensis]|uniref:LysR family transcriptional regulator n=1 Tax=Vreelandella zhaodongensis TaxID=1176240 RepID=A0ABX2SY25_VREZH|nr:LysR family transcriptional regulator [Halomonas zhaodongensis]NYS46378.1 LysR family transcriptional regulator [Halomonas zhaodongensis]